ncbi:hypothetical protein PAMH19_3838 [Pseudomonas aeruginosa]|nr:hypothetical protein PAMH19_3838 [Pseudomonas aeruginosa]
MPYERTDARTTEHRAQPGAPAPARQPAGPGPAHRTAESPDRPGRSDRRRAHRVARRRPRVGGRRAGARQDPAGTRPGALLRRRLRAHPVHPRPDAQRRHRPRRIRPRQRAVQAAQGAGVHPPAAGGRDQPRAGQDPGRPPGSDAGAPGHPGRTRPAGAAAVHGAGDAEPDRAGRHLSAAGSRTRPLHAQAAHRLPGRSRGTDPGAPGDPLRAQRHARRGQPAAAAEGQRRSRPAADRQRPADRRPGPRLCRAPGPHHPQLAGPGPRRRTSRVDRPGPLRPGPGAAARRRVRGAGRHQGLCPGGPAPSGPAVSGAGHRGAVGGPGPATVARPGTGPRRMKPSRALLALFAALLLLAIGLGSLSALGQRLPAQLHTFWWAALAALLLLGLLDALWARRQAVPKLSRQLSGNLPLGRWSEVRLHLQHTYRRPVRLTLFDHLPAGMDFEYLPQEVELRPGESTEVGYRVRPLNRGHFVFPRCELELPSPLRLWRQRRYLEARGETRVYPDFARLYGAELMAVDHWLNQIGVRGGQRRGLGLEFHQLREFRDGDTLRQIDWKATARKRTPIAREYQDERDQQILFLLDCGRRMRSQDGDLSHFDHALNASLLLAYVALRQGDAVGAMTFAGDDRRHLPPGKGSAQLGALLNTVYDLQTSQRPADFPEAVQAVLSRQRRRALVILVTNLRDEDDEELLGAVKRLGRQHRVLVASLREEVLDTLRHEPVARYEQALAYTGTIDYLNARNGLHEKLAAHGVPVLDARPSELGPELISRYLGWKRAGVL